jgi:hypothetical protein
MNSNINRKERWLSIIFINEFQINLSIESLKELSLVSKLVREKLKPRIFENIEISINNYDFEFKDNIFIEYMNQYLDSQSFININRYNENYYKNLSIEKSLNEYTCSLKDIKRFVKSFRSLYMERSVYYLFRIASIFENLTDLKLKICDIPFDAFTNIGKILPNLKVLCLDNINLLKSHTDSISTGDIVFPSRLSYLKIFSVYVVSIKSLSDSYNFLFNSERERFTYENFNLHSISLPYLKRLDFLPNDDGHRGIEEFLEINPGLELLYTRMYKLNITNSLKCLKSLNIDDRINLCNIKIAYTLENANSLLFIVKNPGYSENIQWLCQLCPNLINLRLQFLRNTPNTYPEIDCYLLSTLSNLLQLKTLHLKGIQINENTELLDFTKLSQIETLKVVLKRGTLLNIKFDSCKNLKRVEFICYDDYFTDEYLKEFKKFKNWIFKFNSTISGYKIMK